eukprot:359516-Chlamydomonas_euryale.AAC.3
MGLGGRGGGLGGLAGSLGDGLGGGLGVGLSGGLGGGGAGGGAGRGELAAFLDPSLVEDSDEEAAGDGNAVRSGDGRGGSGVVEGVEGVESARSAEFLDPTLLARGDEDTTAAWCRVGVESSARLLRVADVT